MGCWMISLYIEKFIKHRHTKCITTILCLLVYIKKELTNNDEYLLLTDPHFCYSKEVSGFLLHFIWHKWCKSWNHKQQLTLKMAADVLIGYLGHVNYQFNSCLYILHTVNSWVLHNTMHSMWSFGSWFSLEVHAL